MVALERDAGFCSAEEDEMEDGDVDVHSPTDASEDSVEVRVRPVAAAKGRRKGVEPRKRGEDHRQGPPAKRPRADEGPFRPWSFGAQEEPLSLVLREKTPETARRSPLPRPRDVRPRRPATVVRPETVLTVPPVASVKTEYLEVARRAPSATSVLPNERIVRVPTLAPVKSEYPAVHPAIAGYYERIPAPHSTFAPRDLEEALKIRPRPAEETERIPRLTAESRYASPSEADPPAHPSCGALEEPSYSARNAEADRVRPETFGGDRGPGPSSRHAPQPHHPPAGAAGQQQRNYKNMTRERRIEANARERTRVHTISAAFDTLRRAVPAYSHNQKLSKLSVLRIACSYILTLSRVAGADYSADQSRPDLSDCVENVSRTIQMEGKLRKKRDE